MEVKKIFSLLLTFVILSGYFMPLYLVNASPLIPDDCTVFDSYYDLSSEELSVFYEEGNAIFLYNIYDDNGEIYAVVYEIDLSEQAELEHQRQLAEIKEKLEIKQIAPFSYEIITPHLQWRTTLENSRLQWTGYIVAGNQNTCGFNHGPSGGSINWNGTGGGNMSVSLGFSWAGFGGSVSIARGRAGVLGHSINVPANLVNRNVLLDINHNVSVRTYRVYENGSHTGGQWVFNSRQTTTAVSSQRARVRASGC